MNIVILIDKSINTQDEIYKINSIGFFRDYNNRILKKENF